MKKLTLFITTFVVLMLTTSLHAQNKVKKDSSKSSTQSVKKDTLVFTVYGMDCPGCEGGLEKQVDKIPGIRFSKANWARQELKIVLHKDSVLKKEAFEKRVKKANLTLKKSP